MSPIGTQKTHHQSTTNPPPKHHKVTIKTQQEHKNQLKRHNQNTETANLIKTLQNKTEPFPDQEIYKKRPKNTQEQNNDNTKAIQRQHIDKEIDRTVNHSRIRIGY